MLLNELKPKKKKKYEHSKCHLNNNKVLTNFLFAFFKTINSQIRVIEGKKEKKPKH